MSTKDFSSKQEKKLANCLGWSVVSGSGAAACHPGDIESDSWLGECKTHVTPGHSISFSKSVWEKIKNEAFSKCKAPVLFVDDGSQEPCNTWCMMPANKITSNCVLHTLSVKAGKSITQPHLTLTESVKKYSEECPEKIHVLYTSWGSASSADGAVILRFEDFKLISED